MNEETVAALERRARVAKGENPYQVYCPEKFGGPWTEDDERRFLWQCDNDFRLLASEYVKERSAPSRESAMNNEKCPECNGTGEVDVTGMTKDCCERCDGSGVESKIVKNTQPGASERLREDAEDVRDWSLQLAVSLDAFDEDGSPSRELILGKANQLKSALAAAERERDELLAAETNERWRVYRKLYLESLEEIGELSFSSEQLTAAEQRLAKVVGALESFAALQPASDSSDSVMVESIHILRARAALAKEKTNAQA